MLEFALIFWSCILILSVIRTIYSIRLNKKIKPILNELFSKTGNLTFEEIQNLENRLTPFIDLVINKKFKVLFVDISFLNNVKYATLMLTFEAKILHLKTESKNTTDYVD